MKVLTVRQPWAWAIFHAGKNVENRTWQPRSIKRGDTIAIHVAKKVVDDWVGVRAAHGGSRAATHQLAPSVGPAIMNNHTSMESAALDRRPANKMKS